MTQPTCDLPPVIRCCSRTFTAAIGSEATKVVYSEDWLCTLDEGHAGPHDWPEGRAKHGPSIHVTELPTLDTILANRHGDDQ